MKREFSEDDLYFMARYNPAELARLIAADELDTVELTYAAEFLGGCCQEDWARIAVVPLLSHPVAVVREGAIYGLMGFVSMRCAIAEVAERDPHEGVRRAARICLA